MSVSGRCYQCGKVKRLEMIVTTAGIEYLCKPCRRELGYSQEAAR